MTTLTTTIIRFTSRHCITKYSTFLSGNFQQRFAVPEISVTTFISHFTILWPTISKQAYQSVSLVVTHSSNGWQLVLSSNAKSLKSNHQRSTSQYGSSWPILSSVCITPFLLRDIGKHLKTFQSLQQQNYTLLYALQFMWWQRLQ